MLALGIPASGFMDAISANLANRLVGNAPDAALLESLLGDVELEVTRDVWVAVTGAPAVVHVLGDGVAVPVGANAPLHVTAGSRLRIDSITCGMRSYISFRGGIDCAPTLGSRSTDTLSGLGPAALGAGDELAIDVSPVNLPHVDVAPGIRVPATGEVLRVPFTLGPRADRLRSPEQLVDRVWDVSSRQDRVGMKLTGDPLELGEISPLPSEGTIAGAIEVPPDGQPYVLMRDHPVTVGYPVVGVVEPEAISLLAQARPGCRVRFVLRPGSGGFARR